MFRVLFSYERKQIGRFSNLYWGNSDLKYSNSSIFLKTISKPEAVVQRCSVKKAFLEISQNSQENTCAGVSFLRKLFSCELCEISKNTYFHKTPLVAASSKTLIIPHPNYPLAMQNSGGLQFLFAVI